jgi:hypothetical protein
MVRAVQDLDDELKTTTAIAKRVIPHMAQWKAPLTPENYHLWFEYSIGSNERLTCEINEIIVSKKPFTSEVKPLRPPGRGFASRAYAPGKEDCHFCIAPLDPALPDGACGEQAGQ